MKQPTTEWSIAMQNKIQINREFLISQGWILKDERPLMESFEHSKNKDLVCVIGLHGALSICELHWCNKTPEREFSTVHNPSLTKDDYFMILKLLGIKI